MTERDERALRQALQDLGSDEPVDLGQVRRRAAERRRNGRTAAGLAVALVLLAGVVGLPQLIGGGGSVAEQRGRRCARPGRSPGPRRTRGPAARAGGRPAGRQVAPTPTDAAPDGWRTEYYRDISFEVPAGWGYAVPPDSDWCADGRRATSEARAAHPVRLAGHEPTRSARSAARRCRPVC